MSATSAVKGVVLVSVNPLLEISKQVNAKPNTTASIANNNLPVTGRGISLPDFCVRKMEKIISTTMPPTYTMICTAAINATSIQKYKPAMHINENNNQIAARKIFLVVTANIPAANKKADRM